MIKLCTLAALMLLSAGCNGKKTIYDPMPPEYVKRTGLINHVVFFELMNPEDSEELIRDCYWLLWNPGTTSGYAGKHYDIGRESVMQDYDVGFFIAFKSEDAYRAYIEHPTHVGLVEKWKPRCISIRVYDIGDAISLKWTSAQ